MPSQLSKKPSRARRSVGESLGLGIASTAALWGLAGLISLAGVPLLLALLLSTAILALGTKIVLG